ncbi:MAG TPA: hydantoinase B/oxoprolinase family protein [Caulobacteraceae bacterium]|nr:hydantoinase B/oxoprolinase family protein [Caulobacteraceae bacterium]
MIESAPRGWEFWIDRGGTFTDVIGRGPDGAETSLKLLSVSPSYEDAGVEAMRRLMGVAPRDGFPAKRVEAIKLGTTVATNALLERNGANTLLVTTRGFADALLIGDQARPALFALDIEKPAPLFAGVVEAEERLDAAGAVLRPLDEPGLAAALARAARDGFESVAIAFLHADLNPVHERRAGELAQAAGFRWVSLSSDVSPLPRFIPRAETTVVDAYLTPVLAAYVARLEAAVAGAPLFFMTSGGALVRAGAFRGRDALVSGPAGGVVGVAGVAGGRAVLGFDMGGTSTDVCRYAGALERRDVARVAGARVRAPMLDVETVAAGGGSILAFDGLRARVGPASAGADPGPACYGRGGPATVTDANLVLGRLDPVRFPNVFGPKGNGPLDVDAARRALGALAEAMGATSAEAAAEGFLAVAVEQMAGAIRRISTERGFDPREHALVAFGGAAGQVACQVAEALGVTEVISPQYASVLSAWGIGQARMRVVKAAGLGRELDAAGLAAAEALAGRLAKDAALALAEQNAAAGPAERRLYLAYEEADAALPVPLADLASDRAAFEAAHRRLFGFVEPDRRIVIASVEVERAEPPSPLRGGVGGGGLAERNERLPAHSEPLPIRPPSPDPRPASGRGLIVRPDTQIWVAPGWTAEEERDGTIRLRRTKPAETKAAAASDVADPVTLELYNRRFMGIAEAMGAALERTAHSVNIKERLDFSCALFDAGGGLVANAPHMPVHLGSMGASVRAVCERHPILKPGEAFALNSPYAGGTHLPDITVVMPVFGAGAASPAFFVAARGHHADVGGIQPGSMPPFSHTIDEEGALLDALPIMRGGVFLEAETRAALGAGRWPARAPDRNVADLKAQIAACQAGAAAVAALIERQGDGEVARYMAFVQANAEAAVRRAVGVLKDGSARVPMDGGGEIVVRASVDAAHGEAVLDFTGSSAQLSSNFNAPASVVDAAALYVFRCLVDDDIPLNAGCLTPLRIIVPQGSMLNPRPPAAVVAGNVETSQHVVDALFAALGVAAASQGTMNNLTFGDDERQYYETICGGAGATARAAGASAVHTHMTNSRLTDPEILERRFPVRLEAFEIRRRSGGDGAHPGGDGTRRRIVFLAPMQVALLSTRREHAPQGIAGGGPALAGRQRLIETSGAVKELPGCFSITVRPGDAVEIETPGGGGYGQRRR